MKNAFQFPQKGTYTESIGLYNRLVSFLRKVFIKIKNSIVINDPFFSGSPVYSKEIAERVFDLCRMANNGNKRAKEVLIRCMNDPDSPECPYIGYLHQEEGGPYFEPTKFAEQVPQK